jgi:hypothetical protein
LESGDVGNRFVVVLTTQFGGWHEPNGSSSPFAGGESAGGESPFPCAGSGVFAGSDVLGVDAAGTGSDVVGSGVVVVGSSGTGTGSSYGAAS